MNCQIKAVRGNHLAIIFSFLNKRIDSCLDISNLDVHN